MNQFKLLAGDILVNRNTGIGLWAKIKRWAVGEYSHVFLYSGKIPIGKVEIPLLFESYGRGVCLRSLSERYNQEVVVLRLKSEADRRRIPRVLEEAVRLASDPQARYDYACIPLHIIPRPLHEKFGIPIPLKYHRNEEQVCSEAVFEVFDRAKLPDILRFRTKVPLPGDFIESSLLYRVWEGYLLPGMDVHHINEIKNDDRPENLEELTRGEHNRRRRKKLKSGILSADEVSAL